MHIKVYMNTAGHNSEREVLRSMYDGIKKIEIPSEEVRNKELKELAKSLGRKRKVEYEYEDSYKLCDVAVFLGSWKPDRSRTWHETRTSIKQNANCFVVIETPLLGRQMFQKNQYYRVGINGFLNRDAYWGKEQNYPSDRFENLDLQYMGWKKKRGDKIVVALQLAGDASLRNNDINEWCLDTVNELRQHTDRPIEIRTHPGVSEKGMGNHEVLFQKFAFSNFKDVSFVNGRNIPWEDQLEDAYCVVSYTSGLSIDAVYRGIPVIATDEGNFTWGVTERKLNNVENLNLATEQEVQQWLYNLAYCQWTPDEMEEGIVWNHLKPTIDALLKEQETV